MLSLAGAVGPAVPFYFIAQEQAYLANLPEALSDLEAYLHATDDAALHALLVGALVASLASGVQAAQLQMDITLSTNQTNPFVQDYLSTQSLPRARGINQTTRDQLRASLSEGIASKEGIPELSKRVENVFPEAKGTRATVIARTQTAQAYAYTNYQTLQVMFDQGVINARR